MCGLREDGSVLCWKDYGVSPPEGYIITPSDDFNPPEGARFVAIDAGTCLGNDCVCGVRDDGFPACWGEGFYSLTSSRDDYTSVSVGSFYCATRKDGVVACSGPTDPPDHERFVSVSAGDQLACGLRDDGFVVCWGFPSHLAKSPEEGGFTAVSVNGSGMCGLQDDGSVVCWAGDFWPDSLPAKGGRYTTISVGSTHEGPFACVLGDRADTPQDDGLAFCWGRGWDGPSSPPENGGFTAISASGTGVASRNARACALREDGVIVCWGNEYYGEFTPALR